MSTSSHPTFVAPGMAVPAVSSPGLWLELAGVVVELPSLDERWIAKQIERYGQFLKVAAGAVIEQETSSPRLRGRAQVLPSKRQISPEGTPSSREIDTMLVEVLPTVLAPGLVAHATLLTDGTQSYLCCGHSGAGKSTLAALLPEHALCDELAAVRKTSGGFEGVSLPYWNARPGSAPLTGIFLLEHAPQHHRERLTSSESIRELRQHVCWPTGDHRAMEEVFSTLADIAQTIPVWRLGFRKDPGVWHLITEPTT